MTINAITTIAGPNVYHHRPVLLMKLQLGELDEVESTEVEGFNDRLTRLLPGLADHHCGLGRPGGFVERLQTGTWFGHIVEHVAIELSGLAGIRVSFGKTRYAWEPGVFNVVVTYRAEHGMRYLLERAVEIVDAVVRGEDVDVASIVARAKDIVAETELGPSTRAIVEAAERRGIPWTRIGDGSLVQFGYGVHLQRIQAAMTSRTSAIGTDISCDKQRAREVLEQASIPVPRGNLARTAEEAIAVARTLGVPIVVKPLDGSQGRGVTLGPETDEEIRAAFEHAGAFGTGVVVEELIDGRNYRVLVVGGRMVAAAERAAPQVFGDGVSTIEELVASENGKPTRGNGHECALTRIRLDPSALAYLARSGRTPSSVPAIGEVVTLRDGLNLSTGGTARDVTDEVHPTMRIACERAARSIGLDICGVDLMASDIRRPLREGQGAIIEVNAAPGLRMHLHPSEGQGRDVGEAIMQMLYPDGARSRVPITAITGTNGKTTVTRLIAHVAATAGLCVGATTTDGIEIGGVRVAEGDMTGPGSARTVLSDTAVEFAVLETARGGIIRRGLGYDWSDVGVMTNIQPDHFGQDGIRGARDLLHIKALVAERVRVGGTVVLNADDPLLVTVPESYTLEGRRIVYFAIDGSNSLIEQHCAGGGTAFYVEHGWVTERTGVTRTRLIRTENVPITLGGRARYQVANVLAATAAARANGFAAAQVASALRSFAPSRQNPGRGAFFMLPTGVRVLVDYGHNPEALRAAAAVARAWGSPVTGVLGAPGDRTDGLIGELGRIAARAFDRIVLVEDHDLRGRRPGEIATILCQAAKEASPHCECVIVLEQVAALATELRRAQPGETVAMFYDKLEPVLELLERVGAVAVDPDSAALESRRPAPATSGGMALRAG